MSKLAAMLLFAALSLSIAPGITHAVVGGAMEGAFKGAMFGRLVGGKKSARRAAAVGGVLGAAADSKRQQNARAQEARIAERNASLAAERMAQEARIAEERQRARIDASVDVARQSLVSETQRSLVRLGFDPGPIGQESDALVAAVAAYQREAGLLETGDLSDALLKHMIRNGG